MKTIRKYIDEIKNCEELRKKLLLLSIITALFICILILKPSENNIKYIVGKSGNLLGIERIKTDKNEALQIKLSIKKDGKTSNRTVIIKKQAANKTAQNNKTKKENKELEREAEINGIITDIELSDKRIIRFPSKLSDGSMLIWERKRKNSASYLYMLFFFVLISFLLIKASIDSKNNEQNKHREEILRALPRFTNQLLLMMNAGMILSDAFERIVKNYRAMNETERGFFENELIVLNEINHDHRVSTASLLNEWANATNVKELMRISTILTENERRGSNIIDNLSRESKYLWDDRKIIARENGKLIDTKMSYPMGLLLIVLIVITMAPAMMNL